MSGLVWPGNLINFICRSSHLFYCVTLIGTMESFEFLDGYICSICVNFIHQGTVWLANSDGAVIQCCSNSDGAHKKQQFA